MRVSFLTGIVCLVAFGCGKQPEPISVFVSGDTSGWITPCGCTSNQSGGLARRDTLISRFADQKPVLVFDVGGAVGGRSPYDWQKLKAILRGQMAMGLDVFNLGGPECQFPPDDLRRLMNESQIPLVSANVSDANGTPIAPAYRLLEAGGQELAVIGVVSTDLVAKPLIAKDPYRTIFDLLDELQSRRIIVLAYMDEPDLKELARKLPDIDAVIGGPTGQTVSPTRVGKVLVSSSTNKGKFLLRLDLDPDLSVEAEIVEVSSDIAIAPRQQSNLKAFYNTLADHDFTPNQTRFLADQLKGSNRDQVAGTASCVPCHQQDDSIWHDSQHAHAWASLESTGAQVDPVCQRCHTTGYGVAGGFVSAKRSVERSNVGCETCHGPSSQHAADPDKKTPFVATAQCVVCHDHENSPTFDFDHYWAEIIHGEQE